MTIARKYNPFFYYGSAPTYDEKYNISIDDPDERIEALVEECREEYYAAWYEYVREYD